MADEMSEAERVRYLAYKIWESEGRPEGQQQRHWDMALKIVATEQAAGTDASLEEVGEPVDEAPILEDELPLEEDEVGIQENRLPLEPPDGEPSFDEVPFRDDKMAGTDLPVQDRGHPEQAPPPAETTPPPGPMEPLPEDSATAKRARRPRRSDDTLTPTNETDTTQVPGKTAARTRARKSTASADTTQKPAKTAKATKATKTTKDTKADQKPKAAKKPKTTKATKTSDPS